MSEHTVEGAARTVNPAKRRTAPRHAKWTIPELEAAVREVCDRFGHFPSAQELKSIDRNDIAVQVSRHGGWIYWSDRVGVPRIHSDSDTGWAGERAFMELVIAQGIPCERMPAVKHPFDLLADGILRIDVKAARFAVYPPCSGWFYRIGKAPQADVVALYQLDTGNFYALPWWLCPKTNITISRDGGKYAEYLNNWPLIRQMLDTRKREQEVVA